MSQALVVCLTIGLLTGVGQGLAARHAAPPEASRAPPKSTAAAEYTRTRLLTVSVTGMYQDVRLGDILKDFAGQIEMKADQPLLWSYGTAFPFAKRVSFSVKEQPLDRTLDKLLKQAGGLGYVVVSSEDDRYDGWVRLTTTGERGLEAPPPTAEEETIALDRLKLARKLIDAGKPASARPLLEILVTKYAATKAGKEAKGLLGMLDK